MFLGVTSAPVERFLAVDFVRRGFGFRHLFLGKKLTLLRGVPWEAASATSPRASVSYFRKTGGEKRNRFGRVFEFKSTIFDRFETNTHPRYAPQKLDSRVALLEKVH